MSDVEDSDLFRLAAAEARDDSRRYWARGGAADRKYPVQPMPWWPAAPDDEHPIESEPLTRRGKIVRRG